MKERPILFSGEMVRAILARAKTQTRREMKPQPDDRTVQMVNNIEREPGRWWPMSEDDYTGKGLCCPFGQPGDRLWVRETFAADVPGCEEQGGFSYRADHRDPKGDGPANPMRWTPSIHMPRRASRLTLEITGVRVERLQDVSDADVRAEGIDPPSPGGAQFRCLSERFGALWSDIYGAESWDANPWVWVVGFKRVQP